jgi:hypothetical protein
VQVQVNWIRKQLSIGYENLNRTQRTWRRMAGRKYHMPCRPSGVFDFKLSTYLCLSIGSGECENNW